MLKEALLNLKKFIEDQEFFKKDTAVMTIFLPFSYERVNMTLESGFLLCLVIFENWGREKLIFMFDLGCLYWS